MGQGTEAKSDIYIKISQSTSYPKRIYIWVKAGKIRNVKQIDIGIKKDIHNNECLGTQNLTVARMGGQATAAKHALGWSLNT
jgi:hypothetical protein